MSDSLTPLQCRICMESITNVGTKRAVTLNCGHVFCEECANRMYATRKSCGVCRTGIEEGSILPIYLDFDLDYVEELTRNVQEDNDRLRVERERLNRICNNLNSVVSCQLVSVVIGIEQHPHFVRGISNQLTRQLAAGLKTKFIGFRIASGRQNQCGVYSLVFGYLNLLAVIANREPLITVLRRIINASTHKIEQDHSQYGLTPEDVIDYRSDVEKSLELIELLDYQLDKLSYRDGVNRLERIFNSVHGLAIVRVMRLICKMQYLDLIDVYSLRIGHSNSREEYTNSITNGMLLEGHLMIFSDVFGLNIVVFDVRNVGRVPSESPRIAVNRIYTTNQSQEILQPKIYLFQSDEHYDLLIKRLP